MDIPSADELNQLLVPVLNGAPQSKRDVDFLDYSKGERERILRFVQTLKGYYGLVDRCIEASGSIAHFARDFRRKKKAALALHQQLRQELRSVEEAISACRIPKPRYLFTGLPYSALFPDEAVRRPVLSFFETGSGKAEAIAIENVLGLVEAGLFDRLRTCSCGKWFFASRKDSLCCGIKCRRSKFEKTQSNREWRSAYMRWYREPTAFERPVKDDPSTYNKRANQSRSTR